jgi:hypothetical protein
VLDLGLVLFVPFRERIVATFVLDQTPDLACLYHFTFLKMPDRIRRGYLFVRFAWNIFKSTTYLKLAAEEIAEAVSGPSGGRTAKRKGGKPAVKPRKKLKKGNDKDDNGGNDDDDDESSADVVDREEEKDLGSAFDPDSQDSKHSQNANNCVRDDEALLAIYEAQDASLKGEYFRFLS